jgi:hypothetical protein
MKYEKKNTFFCSELLILIFLHINTKGSTKNNGPIEGRQ